MIQISIFSFIFAILPPIFVSIGSHFCEKGGICGNVQAIPSKGFGAVPIGLMG
jgi:hypothetical protein